MKKYLTTLLLAFILITPTLDISALSVKDYNVVKSDLKAKMSNRHKVKLNNTVLNAWIKVANKELKKCKLKNVNTRNIIDIINLNCL